MPSRRQFITSLLATLAFTTLPYRMVLADEGILLHVGHVPSRYLRVLCLWHLETSRTDSTRMVYIVFAIGTGRELENATNE